MTFSIPDEVAERFVQEVPSAEQSEFLTESLLRRLRVRPPTEEEWASAAEAANADPETRQIQAEFEALPDTMNDDWHDSSAR